MDSKKNSKFLNNYTIGILFLFGIGFILLAALVDVFKDDLILDIFMYFLGGLFVIVSTIFWYRYNFTKKDVEKENNKNAKSWKGMESKKLI